MMNSETKLDKIHTQHFINNEFVNSIGGGTFQTIDPSTEKVLAEVQRAGKDDVDSAVQAAKSAFIKWRDVSGPERRDLMLKLANLMEENKQYLAEWESRDSGKPIDMARDNDVTAAIKHLKYFAGWCDKLEGKTIPTEDVNCMAMTLREPVGVVGCIIPWNFPLILFVWKLSPLLATGNTAVVKSSEKTPLTALLMCQLIKQAGFPPGVVNVLSGFGPDCGEEIARHPDIAKINFTGSSAVGHKIVQCSSESNLKRVTLELGGKSPMIICEDADLDEAVDLALKGVFSNAGQICCAPTRIFLPESIHDEFVKKCVKKAKARKLGTAEGMDQGPLIDEVQCERVVNYIKSGKKEGAKCVTGGKRSRRKGFYIEPTIFTEVKDDMKIAKEEIFGPVMQLIKFKTIEEAITRANATPYGLAAGVCSTNIAVAMGIAKRLEAGTVWINSYLDSGESVPFGGYKESGWGRENGQYALDNFTNVKLIQVPINNYNA